MKKTEITESSKYYDENYEDYENGWSKEHLHHGIWFDETKCHEESLINTIKVVIEHLNIVKDDVILDAGCGSGGTCRYISQNYESMVYGITNSTVLFKKALELSKGFENEQFYLMNFSKTSFKNEFFTKILAIESMIYAKSKKKFLKEVNRILQRGGRLVILDAFMSKKKLCKEDRIILNDWLRGWCVPNISSIEKYNYYLSKYGFENIQFIDYTELIRKSIIQCYNAAKDILPKVYYMWCEGKVPHSRLFHTISLYRQYECVNNNIWKYGCFIADKY